MCVCVCRSRRRHPLGPWWERARARAEGAVDRDKRGEGQRVFGGRLSGTMRDHLWRIRVRVCVRARPLSGTPWLARSRPKFAAAVLSDPIYSPAVVTRPARPRIPICRRARIASRATRAPRADTPPCATPAPSTAFAIRKMRARPRREEVCVEDSERAAGDSEGVDREAKGTMSRRGVLHRTDARSLTLSRHGADALTVYSAISPRPDVPTD